MFQKCYVRRGCQTVNDDDDDDDDDDGDDNGSGAG